MLRDSSFVPVDGDIIWVNFDPVAGHEQGGHRPAVVVSREPYNKAARLVMCVPITTKSKGYPFEVKISTMKKECYALSDQLSTLDYVARNATRGGRVTPAELEQIRSNCKAIAF